jgi:hypothetical protein
MCTSRLNSTPTLEKNLVWSTDPFSHTAEPGSWKLDLSTLYDAALVNLAWKRKEMGWRGKWNELLA